MGGNYFSTIFYRDWIIDTGVTDHMPHDDQDFLNLKSNTSLRKYVTLPNRQKSKVTRIGYIQLDIEHILNNLLLVPDFRYNLFFVSRLTENLGFLVRFFPDSFIYVSGPQNWYNDGDW